MPIDLSPNCIQGAGPETLGAVTASSTMKALTAPGANNTKGAYTEMSAATTDRMNGFYLSIDTDGSVDRFFFDVAIGAAASEVVICKDIPVAIHQAWPAAIYIPVVINGGERVSIRYQTNDITNNITAAIYGFRTGFSPLAFQYCQGVGLTAGTTSFPVVTNSNSFNIKSAWGELVSSITGDHKAIQVIIGDNGVSPSNPSLLDIGIGASSSEVAIMSNIWVLNYQRNVFWPVPMSIPNGSRISARFQRNSAASGTLPVGIVVYQ